jgi:hypothetical protein
MDVVVQRSSSALLAAAAPLGRCFPGCEATFRVVVLLQEVAFICTAAVVWRGTHRITERFALSLGCCFYPPDRY